jgi:hypothetical protein
MQTKKLILNAKASDRQQLSRLQELRLRELNRGYQQQLRYLRHVVKAAREKRNLSTNAS